MLTRIVPLTLSLLMLTGSAHGQSRPSDDDPVQNFEFAWQALDRTYVFFKDTQLDWDAIHNVYRPRVTSETTPQELFDLLLSMVGHLHDGHVAIDRNDGKGQVHAEEVDWTRQDRDFSSQLIKSEYLNGKYSEDLHGCLTSGWLTNDIAYLRIADFKQGQQPTCAALDAILEGFSGAKGVVVDMRMHPGGKSNTARLAAGRFADRKRHYMRTRMRYGPTHDGLAPITYRYVQPGGPMPFTRPVVVLVHRFTESAGEDFMMAASVLPHVTTVGERTAGALGSQYPVTMPNGWRLWMPYMANLDHNGVSWNGVGLTPDIYMVNAPADIESGRDRVLEFALDLLQLGQLKPQDESGSLRDMKTSIVETFDKILNEKGREAAIAEVARIRATDDGRYFFGVDEAFMQVQQYLARERFEEAAELSKICVNEFPEFAGGYGMLAYCLVKSGQGDAARAMVEKAEAMEATYAFERTHLEMARKELKTRP